MKLHDDPDDVLDWLLGPVDLDAFLEEYWESQPLHVSRGRAQHFASLISVERIETLLSTTPLYFPGVQLTRAGDPISADDYTDDSNRVVARRAVRLYAAGATIVLSQVQRLLQPLQALCQSVQAQLRVRCQTNAYLTPPGSQGFGAHFDSHDVFILQISGSKTFRFYEGGPTLPLPDQRFDASTDRCGPLSETVTLKAGDTLYVPRGVMHDAIANGDEASLHVTLGVFPISVLELTQELLATAAESDVNLRHSLPGMPWSQPALQANAADSSLRDTLLAACSSSNLAAALARLQDDLALEGQQDCRGQLVSPSDHAALSSETQIALRSGAVLSVEELSESLRLRVSGRVLAFGSAQVQAVQAVLRGRALALRDLPALDAEQQLALGRQLLAEAVVEIVDS